MDLPIKFDVRRVLTFLVSVILNAWVVLSSQKLPEVSDSVKQTCLHTEADEPPVLVLDDPGIRVLP